MKRLIITIIAALGLLGAVYGSAAALDPPTGVETLGSAAVAVVNDADVTVTKVDWTVSGGDVTDVIVTLNNAHASESRTCDVAMALGSSTGGEELAKTGSKPSGSIAFGATGDVTFTMSSDNTLVPAEPAAADVVSTTVTVSACA